MKILSRYARFFGYAPLGIDIEDLRQEAAFAAWQAEQRGSSPATAVHHRLVDTVRHYAHARGRPSREIECWSDDLAAHHDLVLPLPMTTGETYTYLKEVLAAIRHRWHGELFLDAVVNDYRFAREKYHYTFARISQIVKEERRVVTTRFTENAP